MENIIYEDKFYGELSDLIEDILYDEDIEEVLELPDDFTIEVFQCELEPMFKIDLNWFLNRLDEDRFPEDNERIDDEMCRAIENNCNFAKMNEEMPKLYYPKEKVTLTKQDLLNY